MTVRDATPLLVVTDIAPAVQFMADHLGFEAPVVQDTYAYLLNGTGAIRLLTGGPDFDPDDPRRQQSCYIDVANTDAFYAEHKTALDTLPEGHFRAPFDQDYGQRELHVIYQSILFFVGAALPSESRP